MEEMLSKGIKYNAVAKRLEQELGIDRLAAR